MSTVTKLPVSDALFEAAEDEACIAGDQAAEAYRGYLGAGYSAQCVAMGALDYLIDTVGYEQACETFDELAEWFKEQAKR